MAASARKVSIRRRTREEGRRQGSLIPLLVHRIWLGSDVPARFDLAWQSWHEAHPNYRFITWTEAKVHSLRLPTAYRKATTREEQSDIARLAILNQLGGVYTDCDVTAHRSLSRLFTPGDTFVAFEEDYGLLWNGLLASVPGSPMVRRAIRSLNGRCAQMSQAPPNEKTGPVYLTTIYRRQLFSNPVGIRIYPPGFAALDNRVRVHTWATTQIEHTKTWTPVPRSREVATKRAWLGDLPRFRDAAPAIRAVLHGADRLHRTNCVAFGEDDY